MQCVVSTFPSQKSVKKLARETLKQRFAGCILTIPVGSIFRWNAKIEDTKEVLAVFKTTKERALQLRKFIETHHPYEVPFVTVLPLKEVNNRYQRWLEKELKSI